MNAIYPHTISIVRPIQDTGLGATAYSGETDKNTSPIAQDIAAGIQLMGGSGKPEGNLPADAPRASYWRILIPNSDLPAMPVLSRDIATDETGRRFQVVVPYMNALGYKIVAERLES